MRLGDGRQLHPDPGAVCRGGTGRCGGARIQGLAKRPDGREGFQGKDRDSLPYVRSDVDRGERRSERPGPTSGGELYGETPFPACTEQPPKIYLRSKIADTLVHQVSPVWKRISNYVL